MGNNKSHRGQAASAKEHESKQVGDQPNSPEREDISTITVLSWNLDGLDPKSLLARTEAASVEINRLYPDIVYLQEVTPMTWKVIGERTSGYFEQYQSETYGYYTVIMLKKTVCKVKSVSSKPYANSVMQRGLQIVRAEVKGVSLQLMTSHLESTPKYVKPRRDQLLLCLQEMAAASSDYNVLFGGDLNIVDDDELEGIVFPSDIMDFWKTVSDNDETKYTWDNLQNDNRVREGFDKFQRRLDRMYFKSSKGSELTPARFQLFGTDRLPDCGRFISDHWGIVCQLSVKL